MADMAAHLSHHQAHSPHADARPHFEKKLGLPAVWIFLGVLIAGLIYSTQSIIADVSEAHVLVTTWAPFILLGIALLVALGFEFVNGFHDTANAVATVIYTHSLPPHFAVVWSGLCNLAGVLVSTGSACSSGKEEPSPVLLAMGYAPDQAGRVLRFSSGWETGEEDWETLLAAAQQAARELGGAG